MAISRGLSSLAAEDSKRIRKRDGKRPNHNLAEFKNKNPGGMLSATPVNDISHQGRSAPTPFPYITDISTLEIVSGR